jgi:hypothetical protein
MSFIKFYKQNFQFKIITNMKKIFFLTAMAVMILASCGKDNGSDNILNPQEGAKATLSIKMAFPQTYATVTATEAESTVNTVHVLIFDAGSGDLINHAPLTMSHFEEKTQGIYTTKNGIITTAGTRKVLVGVNLPTAIVTEITNNTKNTDAVDKNTVYDVTAALIATSGNFVMFSTEMPDVTLESDESLGGNVNTVSLSVERLAGKAALAKAEGFTLGTALQGRGSFTKIEYKLMQTNLKSYLMRDPDRKDPNYLAAQFDDLYDETAFENAEDYITLADGNDHANRPAFYGAENTADLYLKALTTYFLVKGTFVPSKFYNNLGTEVGYSYTPGDDFWSVTDGTDVYTCSAPAIATSINSNVFFGAGTITHHEGGYCYYRIWIGGDSGDHGFLRNNYYVGQIGAINGLGEGSEGDIIVDDDEDDDDPTDPVDDDDKATIECSFEILPWTLNLADPVEVF